MSEPLNRQLRVIRCGVGAETFALDLSTVHGIQHADRMELNNDGTPIAGTFEMIGQQVPIYRLAELLGVPNDGAKSAHVIVVNIAGQLLGLLVNRVAHVSDVPLDNLKPLSPIFGDPRGSCFYGVLKIDQELLLLLAPDRFDPDGRLPQVDRYELSDSYPADFYRELQAQADRIVLFHSGFQLEESRPLAFGLGINQVAEIVEYTGATNVPGAPECIKGLIPWRDTVVPVIDFEVRFGLSAQGRPESPRVIIIRGPHQMGPIGVYSQYAMRMLKSDILNAPCAREFPFDTDLLFGSIELKKETLVLPNMEAVLRI